MTKKQIPAAQAQLVAAIEQNNTGEARAALIELLKRPGATARLRALDAAGSLTRLIPELEPARHTDQPNVHFLPVLAHSLETVAAVEWLLGQIEDPPAEQAAHEPDQLPAAIQANPSLRYSSSYRAELQRHFATSVGARYPRAALFKLAALLHDIAKPATKQSKPDGGVSFHEHQTRGGEIAATVGQRLGFDEIETKYLRTIVREHMRPGQLWVLDEITLRAVQRFFHATGDAGPDVLLHLLADHMATRGPNIHVPSWIAQARWIDALLGTIWAEEAEPERLLLTGRR